VSVLDATTGRVRGTLAVDGYPVAAAVIVYEALDLRKICAPTN